MRTVTLFAAAAFLSACTSMNQTAGTYSDDVYASSKDLPQKKEVPAPERRNPDPDPSPVQRNERTPNSTAVQKDEQGNTYITNKYYESDFDYDDYYDYEYAVRMKRFYHPVSSYGYYDNYYTNSYWYSYEPAHWVISVYYGYPWWG